LDKKLQSQTESTEKQQKTRLHKKAARQMLVKLTPCGQFRIFFGTKCARKMLVKLTPG